MIVWSLPPTGSRLARTGRPVSRAQVITMWARSEPVAASGASMSQVMSVDGFMRRRTNGGERASCAQQMEAEDERDEHGDSEQRPEGEAEIGVLLRVHERRVIHALAARRGASGGAGSLAKRGEVRAGRCRIRSVKVCAGMGFPSMGGDGAEALVGRALTQAVTGSAARGAAVGLRSVAWRRRSQMRKPVIASTPGVRPPRHQRIFTGRPPKLP